MGKEKRIPRARGVKLHQLFPKAGGRDALKIFAQWLNSRLVIDPAFAPLVLERIQHENKRSRCEKRSE